MKNKVRVIRSAGKTIVIYSEATKPGMKIVAAPFKQKPILVRIYGQRSHYIMPDGSTLPIRIGRLWRLFKTVYPRARFAV